MVNKLSPKTASRNKKYALRNRRIEIPAQIPAHDHDRPYGIK